MGLYGEVVLKLVLALLLGGLIGYQREHKNRPAGLRTHMLVCIGSALVQITSLNYYAKHGMGTDPMRMGAQVISGIGFLGAGTIIKEGANIKGLTTAAGVWAVACIGLTVGTGLYIEAIISSVLLFFALEGFKKLEISSHRGRKVLSIRVELIKSSGVLEKVSSLLKESGVEILGIDIADDDIQREISLYLKMNEEKISEKTMDKLLDIDGIKGLSMS